MADFAVPRRNDLDAGRDQSDGVNHSCSTEWNIRITSSGLNRNWRLELNSQLLGYKPVQLIACVALKAYSEYLSVNSFITQLVDLDVSLEGMSLKMS